MRGQAGTLGGWVGASKPVISRDEAGHASNRVRSQRTPGPLAAIQRARALRCKHITPARPGSDGGGGYARGERGSPGSTVIVPRSEILKSLPLKTRPGLDASRSSPWFLMRWLRKVSGYVPANLPPLISGFWTAQPLLADRMGVCDVELPVLGAEAQQDSGDESCCGVQATWRRGLWSWASETAHRARTTALSLQ